jgi:ketoreductase RED2
MTAPGTADQKAALVTGSSSGIGAELARRLAAAGYRVAVNSSKSAESGARVAAELPGAIYVQADVAEPGQASELIDSVVGEFGRLDLLVNNAGVTRMIPHHDLWAADAGAWRDILAVNVIGTWLVTVAAVPHLRASGSGSVVNISSVAGSRPTGSSIPYAVSKAAVEHMTRLLAATLGPEVRVNAVAPGLIDTDWTADFAEPRKWMQEQSPLRRVGTCGDVAEAVYALANAEFTTGQTLLVDGGTHLR